MKVQLRLHALAVAALAASCGSNPGGPSSGRAVATLADGAWVVTGRFEGSLRFPGLREVASQGRHDIFTARYSADGAVEWVRGAGGTGEDEAWDVAVFTDGSSLATGEFEGTASFGAGEAHAATLSATQVDAFFALYDAHGSLQWARSAGGKGKDFGRGVAALSDGTFLVVGRFEGGIVFQDGEPGEKHVSGRGKHDTFVARFGHGGELLWVTTIGGTGTAYGQDVAALDDGSCVVAGSFDRAADVGDPAAGGFHLESAGNDDVFVCKLAPDGSPLWAHSAGGKEEDSAHGLSAFADGGCVVTGRFGGKATFGDGEPSQARCTAAGERDAFLARYDGDGKLRWARTEGGSGSDYGRAVAARPDGTCIATGYFSKTALFGGGEKNETKLESDGELDIFVARLDPNGRLIEASRLGRWGSERSNGVALLGDGSLVLAGEHPNPDSMVEEQLLVTRVGELESLPSASFLPPRL